MQRQFLRLSKELHVAMSCFCLFTVYRACPDMVLRGPMMLTHPDKSQNLNCGKSDIQDTRIGHSGAENL